jgi:hypothetical protein
MRTTLENDSMTAMIRKRATYPDGDPVIALSPALGPIPPIALASGATPEVGLPRAVTALVASARRALTRPHSR